MKGPMLFWVLLIRILPPISLALPLYIMMTSLGIINTMTPIVLAHILINVPFIIWFLLSFFQKLPVEVEESAMVDGASEWQLFWRIKAPLLGPTLFFVLFISMKDALLICAPIMVMTEGGPFRSTQTIVYQYYIEAFRNSNWSAAAAISTLVFVMAAVITILSMRFEARRLHYEN